MMRKNDEKRRLSTTQSLRMSFVNFCTRGDVEVLDSFVRVLGRQT